MEQIEKIIKGWSIWRKKISAVLACLIIFVTTYLMVLPAITLDRTGAEEDEAIAIEGETSEQDEDWEDDWENDWEDDWESSLFEDVGDSGTAEEEGGADRPFALTYEEENYTVTAFYGEDAELPADAELAAEEIEEGSDEYREYYKRALEAVRTEKGGEALIFYARFYDISFLSEEGEVEPAAPVSIVIDYEKAGYENMPEAYTADAEDMAEASLPDAESMEAFPGEDADGNAETGIVSVVHFDTAETEGQVPMLVEAQAEVKDAFTDSVSFESESFSVYGVIETTLEKIVLAKDGHDYKVSVTYGAETGIPGYADLEAEEITEEASVYDEYRSKTETALGLEERSAGYIRLFDIKIVDRAEPAIQYQPEEGTLVDVNIELADAAGAGLSVVHFAEGADGGDIVETTTYDAETGKTVSFAAEGFSVYAIVDEDDTTPDTKSIKYIFHYSDKTPFEFINKNGESTDTQYVKDGEALFYPGTPLDDPDQDGKEFWGWYEAALNGDTLVWGEEAVFDTPISVSEMAVVDLYARYEQTYYVTYYDENGSVFSIVKHANGDTVGLDVAGTETVYNASNAQKAFLGWATSPGTTSEVSHGSTLMVNGNISLYPAINDVKWINFYGGETGSGASYTAPVYVLGNTVNADKKPADPSRRGYVFRGWYKDEACTQPFQWDGSETITGDITLYAKWEEADTIYTVVIWKQNIDGNGYDYVESRSVDALTGSTASTSAADTGKNYTGFTYNPSKSDTTAVVLANGTTTLNVRYDRNPYALTFDVPGAGLVYSPEANGTWGYVNGEFVQLDSQSTTTYVYTMETYVETTSNSGTQYRIYNGQYTQIFYRRNAWRLTNTNNGMVYNGIRYLKEDSSVYTGTRYTRSGNTYTETSGDGTNLYGLDENGVYLPLTPTSRTTTSYSYNGEPYTGARFTRSNSSNWHTVKTITALYEQDISADFPIVGTNGVTYNNGERWDPQSSTPYNEVLVFIDTMPAANVVFRLDTATRPLKTMNYYVEALPGAENTVSAPNTLYEVTNNGNVSPGGRSFSLHNSISARYNGVTPDEDFIDLFGFTKIGADKKWENRSGTKFYIYSTDSNGTVNFYYSRNSYNLEFRDSNDTSVRYDTRSVKYQYPVENEIIDDPAPPDGYTFHGWYADPSCSMRVFFHEPTAAELDELKYDLNSTGRKTYRPDGEFSDSYEVLETMPAHNYVLYANWAPKRYQINIDPNGGQLRTDGTQATYFSIDYGEKIGEYANVSRNYISISEGQDVEGLTRYSYHYDKRGENGPRQAYYYEDPEGDYIEDPAAYTFVGWYRVADNGEGAIDRAPYNFDTLVDENTTLRALWRREGVFRVKYTNVMNEGKEGELASPAPRPADDAYTYVDLAEAKVGPGIAPPENCQFAGWRVLGTGGPLYQPGDTFVIDSNFAEYDDSNNMYVTLEPVFVQIGDAYIGYDINVPQGSTAVSSTLTDVEDNSQIQLKEKGSVTLSSGDGFAVKGYELIGWSDHALDPLEYPVHQNDDGTFEGALPADTHLFKLGGVYGVSGSNTLHAVWKLITIPVPFTKKGEQPDGTYAPLAGAGFTLYADSGCTQIISDRYKEIGAEEAVISSSAGPGTNAVFPKVPVGTFYFKETSTGGAYSPDDTIHTILVEESEDGSGNRILSYTIDGEDSLTVKNHLKGTLAVTKTVISPIASDHERKFSFTVTLSDRSFTGTCGEMTFVNGTAAFQLADGEEIKAKGLPDHVSYVIEETPVNGFDTTAEGAEGTYVQDGAGTAAFTNTRKEAEIRIGKLVSDTTDTTSFQFTVTLKEGIDPIPSYIVYTDPQGAQTPDPGDDQTLTTDADGKVSFALTHGADITLKVPVGAVMEISEAAEGYAASVSASPDPAGTLSGNTYALTVPDSNTDITFTNTISAKKLRIKKTGDDAPEGLAGASFSLEKEPGGGADQNFEDMTHLVSMTGASDASMLGYLPGNDQEDTALFVLPNGTYTLTETGAPEYYAGLSSPVTLAVSADGITASAPGADGSLISMSSPDSQGIYTLTVENARKKAAVKVIKNVRGVTTDQNTAFSFTAAGLTGTPESFPLYGTYKAAEGSEPEHLHEKEYTEVHFGTTFSVTEAGIYTAFDTEIHILYADQTETELNALSTGELTVNGDIIITYTNTRNSIPLKVVKADQAGRALAGASFEGDLITSGHVTTQVTGTGGDEEAVIIEESAVPSGTYTITETSPPPGFYSLAGPVKIVVKDNEEAEGDLLVEVTVSDEESAFASAVRMDVNHPELGWIVTVRNDAGAELPYTGGPGSSRFYLFGILLTGLAGAGAALKKKMKTA